MVGTSSIPWTYSGLLDDVVDRYGITPEVDADFFNLSILRNILFSGPILLNDGYIFHHPVGLSQLQDNRSLIRQMVKHDFIRILSRSSDPEAFSRLPEYLARRGVETSRQLIAREDWPTIREKALSWANHFFDDRRVQAWPRVMSHEGFKKLFSRIFDKTPEDLGLVGFSSERLSEFGRRYENQPDMQTAPRTAIEKAALSMLAEGLIKRSALVRLMDIANQCYHYNFGMLLSHDMEQAVISDTTVGKAFEDVLEMDQSFEAEVEGMPLITIPKGFPLDRYHLYDDFFDRASKVYNAKKDFINSIDTAMNRRSNRSNANRVDEIKKATEEYRHVLADHFKNYVSVRDLAPRRNAWIRLVWNNTGGIATAATNAILVAEVLSPRRTTAFVQRRTERFNRHALEIALDPAASSEKVRMYRTSDVRPRFSSIGFNQVAIENHVSGLPRWDRST
jgi:hypothetical protein